MGRMSREKGAAGERELCKVLTEAGFPAHRTAPMQAGHAFKGYGDVVIDDAPFYVEVKRCQRVEVERWFAEAKANAGDLPPVVIYRRNGGEWKAVIDLPTFLRLLA